MPDSLMTLSAEAMGGLGEIQILQPPGAFALTPSSQVMVQAIITHHRLLHGHGIDWGSGTGVLAIVASRIQQVTRVLGLELAELNLQVARENARRNGATHKLRFMRADSYTPYAWADQQELKALAGQVQFVLANPPASEGDGFGYRYRVLQEGRELLAPSAVIFLNISYQYGHHRLKQLCEQNSAFTYGGVLSTTPWEPFDLARPDLLHCLHLYKEEERWGGAPYAFGNPIAPETAPLNAREALQIFQQTGLSPLTKWQTHLFRYTGERDTTRPV